MREIRITDGSQEGRQRVLTVPRHGTNPEMGFIWIDGVQYTLSKKAGGRNYTLKRSK